MLLKAHCKNHLRKNTAQQLHPEHVTIAAKLFLLKENDV